MSVLKRTLLFSIALVLLIAIGLGTWVYFFGTDLALRRAEAFRFRRMSVAKLGEQSYRFYYATNRRAEPGAGSLEERFGNEREEKLKFGFFDTEIEPALGLGMIINPTEWFQTEELKVRDLQPLTEAQFVKQLKAVVRKSSRQSLLVVLHGFRERFPSALRKTAFIGHVLDINTPVLLFDWPGDQGSSLRGYRRARRVAKASGAELARTLELIIRDIEPARLWLIANSMGAQVVADAFSLLYQRTDLADPQTEIEDVVLTAPDIDHDQFDGQFKREITALVRNLTVYVSSNDRALLVSRLVNLGRRRGESTLSPDQFAEAVQLSELIDPDSERIALVDVTPVNRTRNFHNFSLETPEFFDDLYLRLTNANTPRSRLQYPIRTPTGKVYWVLTQGR